MKMTSSAPLAPLSVGMKLSDHLSPVGHARTNVFGST
jgi:hypothetical protein